jgi:TM2 domain-containing membrane protein YozV
MDNHLFMTLPNISQEEFIYLNKLTNGFDDEQIKNFYMMYQSRRRDPQIIMITTILGFFALAGIQRFLLNQIGMGIVYVLTGGFCLIGTIIDLVNYNSMTFNYNRNEAWEVARFMNAV